MHTVEDARYAISVFHRKKIGYKRIHVSLVNNDSDGTPPNVRYSLGHIVYKTSYSDNEYINVLRETLLDINVNCERRNMCGKKCCFIIY